MKRTLESRRTDLLEIIFANTADASSRENGGCGENQKSSLLWADFFIYHIYFLWVQDTSHFHIGPDRLGEAIIRHICMFFCCRKHELVYAKPKNLKELVKKLDEESDAYTDVEHDSNECIPRRVKECWVCGQPDERTNNPKLKVLCWEDIEFWILCDPEGNGSRDRLATQTLLRWHKGENKQIVTTWHTFVEEDIPMLCSVSHILAKALSEGAIDNNGYQERADLFFSHQA
ncbi:FluG domain-containing protein, partial [Metarhizium majus ARSEF 297]